MSRQHLSVHGALFLAYVHPSDRFNTEVQLDAALRDGAPYVATYRWIRPDSNEVRFIHCRAGTDPATKLFQGIILDITPETSKLRAEGDLALAVGDLLKHLGLPGLTLDPELTIRSIHASDKDYPISFGVADFTHEKIAPGASLLDCFTSADSKRKIQDTLEKLSGPFASELTFSVDGFQTIVKPLSTDGAPQGIVIFVIDRRAEESARERASQLESEISRLGAARTYRHSISAATQEIAGYSALITRHAKGNPLLGAISDSLLQSIRELALTTDQLNSPSPSSFSKRAEKTKRRRAATSHALRLTSNAHVIFASRHPRCSTSHALALRESGLMCAAADLEETSLLALLRASPTISVLVIDAPTQERGLAPLLRRLKREAPRIHLVCLATNDAEAHSALLRAGAVAVLTKPATARDIEQTVRKLLEIARLDSSQTPLRATP